MATAATLYTPELLGLATQLAEFPSDPDLPLQASVRSKSCGSTLSLGLATDGLGRISHVGMKAQACAIGQAAAAIFAHGAVGRGGEEIALAAAALDRWLAGEGPLPDWPQFALIEPARAYPGRHGAIRLAWQAARELLPTSGMPR